MDTAIGSKKVYLKSWGCQMNVRDSEVICGLLNRQGYKITDESDEADIILFNTCSVRQHAEEKVWSEIGRISKRYTLYPKRYTKPIIGLVGCMAQNYKEKIFERAPGVDFAVGPSDIHKIPEIIQKLSAIPASPAGGRYPLSVNNLYEAKIWETGGNIRPDDIYQTGFYGDKEHAYVVISEGCTNYCTYCVVPFVRGELHNRNYKEILKEIEDAVGKGITKITLLGQNVNAYEYDNVNFVKLIESVNSVRGLKEFSFITSHPKDTGIELFKAMADLDKLKKCLHLPAQSGSDRILKLMNRGYTRKFYLDLVQDYRNIVKGATLTTDIIVGFPTEKDEGFRDTYNLVEEVEFDSAYIFKYSPRPHTEAERFADDIGKREKEKRHKIILDLQKSISNKKKCLKR